MERPLVGKPAKTIRYVSHKMGVKLIPWSNLGVLDGILINPPGCLAGLRSLRKANGSVRCFFGVGTWSLLLTLKNVVIAQNKGVMDPFGHGKRLNRRHT